MATYFISKHSLIRRGILEVKGTRRAGGQIAVKVDTHDWPATYMYNLGTEAHTTREEAVHVAEIMRANKVNALLNQLHKLQALEIK